MGAIHPAFPELNGMIKDLTLPTSLRFLQANPTPQTILRHGHRRFVEKWRPDADVASGVGENSHTIT